MNEVLVVTSLGLLALTVGTVSWTRVQSSGRRRRGRSAADARASDGGDAAEVFDITPGPGGSDTGAGDCGGADAGSGCDGGGGGGD